MQTVSPFFIVSLLLLLLLLMLRLLLILLTLRLLLLVLLVLLMLPLARLGLNPSRFTSLLYGIFGSPMKVKPSLSFNSWSENGALL